MQLLSHNSMVFAIWQRVWKVGVFDSLQEEEEVEQSTLYFVL